MLSAYWNLIAIDFVFIGSITAAITLFTIAQARKDNRETRSTTVKGNGEPLQRAS